MKLSQPFEFEFEFEFNSIHRGFIYVFSFTRTLLVFQCILMPELYRIHEIV